MDQEFPFNHFLDEDNKNDSKQKEIVADGDVSNSQILTNDSDYSKNALDKNILSGEEVLTEEFSGHDLDALNNKILDYLRDSVPDQKFKAYFEHSFYIIGIISNSICFTVPTPFIKTIIEQHFLPQLEEAVESLLEKRYRVIVEVNKSKDSLSSNKQNILNTINDSKFKPSVSSFNKSKNANEASFSLSLTPTMDDLESQVESKYIEHMDNESPAFIDPNKTFDNFVIGPSNHLAFATAKAIASSPGKSGKYPSLYIYSSSGLGKTHLLHSVANGIRENFPHLVICIITARGFMKEFIESVRDKNIDKFQKEYSEKIDVLMIDDIHELKNKKGTQDELFHIFNQLYNQGKQLIFTSDKEPGEIDGIEERIKTRLQWGLVIDIQKPDLETRIAILKKKTMEFDMFIPDDVLNLIAGSIRTNIRELEGSLVNLFAFADLMKEEIDIETAKSILKLGPETDKKEITLENVAKAVSGYYKIPLADLKSKARLAEMANARHVAMYISKKSVGESLSDIGKFYGGRDHSTVLHAVKKVKSQLNTDPALSQDLIFIEENL